MTKYIDVASDELNKKIEKVSSSYVDKENSSFIAEKIVLAEEMNVPTHGLHYFMHSILPHLIKNNINNSEINTTDNIVYSYGCGGIGFYNLHKCLTKASDLAYNNGIALAIIKDPGKIGALRVYCKSFMDKGQLIIMMKNTARTFGILETKEPVFGTNPLCIGLPETDFIYDSSMSTVATNKIRFYEKQGKDFNNIVGLNSNFKETCCPSEISDTKGFLLPFSHGPFWYKSFFLAMAIEGIAAMSGGKTSRRVGEHKGERLYLEKV